MNARMVDANGITFLHEMIHAAYKDLQDHDREPESVFYKHSDELGRPSRDVPIVQYLLKEKHARAIAQSYFGIGGR